MAVRIGIDTGGTFTDVVRLERGRMVIHKVPSTPEDPAQAVLSGLARARTRSDEEVDVVHGTTVGLNAVLTGALARTAWVTNRGFEDLVEIGRQDRQDLYDLQPQRPEIPVPRELRFGVGARRDADGRVVEPFADGELDRLRRTIARAGVEAIAIGLLHSTATPADERRVAKALRPLGVPITCSAELSAHPAEFERFCTAILNAGMAPIMARYMARLGREVGPGRLRLMRSSAGILAPATVAREPARAAFSGPAGGVLATELLVGDATDAPWAAAFDMGGTSTDVCLVGRGGAQVQGRGGQSISNLAGLPLALPAVPVHTVGCGGGSVAFADAGGALRVGPRSAGAHPGPACYGIGDEPTVTDAHMALGHMAGDTLLQGEFPVDVDRSVRAVETLARQLGLTTAAAAEGILEIAEVNMMRALLVITAERAVDPALVALVAYGGAGGLHAAGLRRRLGMRAALVPPCPGAFSAVGLALAGETEECTQAVLGLWTVELEGAVRRDAATAVASMRAQVPSARIEVEIAVRYQGQGTTLSVPLARGSIARAFAAEHLRQFGFVLDERPIEIVMWTARATRRTMRRGLPTVEMPTSGIRAATRQRRAPVGRQRWAILDRAQLNDGDRVSGPCVIEEQTGVTVVPRGANASCSGATIAVEG